MPARTEGFDDALPSPQQVQAGLVQALRREGLIYEREIGAEIDRQGITYQGDTKKSITSEVTRTKQGARLDVGPSIEHAWYVFAGTRPHWPPLAPMERYARLKLGAQDEERVGFLLARHIARYGTEAQDFLTPVLERRLPKTQERFEVALAEIMEG